MTPEFLKKLAEEPTPEEKAAAEEARRKSQEEWQRKVDEEQRLAVPRAIEKLRKEAAEKLAEAAKIEKVLAEFPDLKQYTGRWNKVAYFSKTANAKADRFDLRHNCGCCGDSPLEIWPYFESPIGNVYTDPPKFIVGQREPGYGGDIPTAGWDKTMAKAGIPEGIIGAVGMHFKRCAKAAREAADEIYGGDHEAVSSDEE